MRISVISAALVAALVRYGSTIALVLAAAAALGATAGQTASWVFAICRAKAAGSPGLSRWTRIPVVLAWSTHWAALIAGSAGISMAEAVGAFLLAAGLILLAGLVRPVAGLVSKIPASVAAGMLLFCLAVPHLAAGNPTLLLPVAMQDTYPSNTGGPHG